MTDFAEQLTRAAGPSLERAGFQATASGWTRRSAEAFNAFSVFSAGSRHAALFGWQYPALGDPEPDPPDARGCLRQMSLDVVAPTSDLRSLLAYPEGPEGTEVWERRLRTAWQAGVEPWLDKWSRPDGYCDYLSSRGLHLGAAWVSAVLGHGERAGHELEQAHLAIGQPLDAAFDRARAERDAALAAPFAARCGLAEYLGREELPTEVRDAFGSQRGTAAQSRVTAPDVEHRRLQLRAAVFADLCRRYVAEDSVRPAVAWPRKRRI